MTTAMQALKTAAQAPVSLRAFDPGALDPSTSCVVPSPEPERPTLRARTTWPGPAARPLETTLQGMVWRLPSEVSPSSDSDGHCAASDKDSDYEVTGSPSESSSISLSSDDSEGSTSVFSTDGSCTDASTP